MANTIIVSPSELMKDAVESTEIKAVLKAISEKEAESLIDRFAIKRAKDWAILCQQIFGAESNIARPRCCFTPFAASGCRAV